MQREFRKRVCGGAGATCAAQAKVHAHSYQRLRPDKTLFYQLVEFQSPAFAKRMAREVRTLPSYAGRNPEGLLCCSQREHGFLGVRCDSCSARERSHFRLGVVVSAPAAETSAWPKLRHYWWTRFLLRSLFASEWCVCSSFTPYADQSTFNRACRLVPPHTQVPVRSSGSAKHAYEP